MTTSVRPRISRLIGASCISTVLVVTGGVTTAMAASQPSAGAAVEARAPADISGDTGSSMHRTANCGAANVHAWPRVNFTPATDSDECGKSCEDFKEWAELNCIGAESDNAFGICMGEADHAYGQCLADCVEAEWGPFPTEQSPIKPGLTPVLPTEKTPIKPGLTPDRPAERIR